MQYTDILVTNVLSRPYPSVATLSLKMSSTGFGSKLLRLVVNMFSVQQLENDFPRENLFIKTVVSHSFHNSFIIEYAKETNFPRGNLFIKTVVPEKQLSSQSKLYSFTILFIIEYAKIFHQDFQREFGNNQGKNIVGLLRFEKPFVKDVF